MYSDLIQEAYDNGYAAAFEGSYDCPHFFGSPKWMWWEKGNADGHHIYCSMLENILATFPQD